MFKNIIIHLNLIDRVGPSLIYAIVDAIGLDNLDVVYRYQVADFVQLGVSQAKAELLVAGLADSHVLAQELRLIEQNNVFVVTRWCPQYSALLAEIHTPPVLLYCQGNIDLLSCPKAIACVGARKAHGYVKDVLQHVVAPLITSGWVVVSGGALGADTFAHNIALEHGGATIAVLGSGLCHAYPPQNRPLFARMVQRGSLVVSPFPMNMQPFPSCFPARNRIIAGLSQGCLVLQAASKSGALITAQQALDQGREVFAVPGLIHDPLSAGCHDLIKQGAKLTTDTNDILVELDPAFDAVERGDDRSEQLSIEHEALSNQDPVVSRVLSLLVSPMTADHLLSKVELSLPELQSLLFDLSLEGRVAQDTMGFWVRV